ncbi:MAG: hypothetical protein KDA37_15585, partial [Planctomycetales bacterium]|nr:hypothetical protein [Planctomycetales bacterium]
GDGDDTLLGGEGVSGQTSTLDGGAGDDQVFGSALGSDHLSGGDGNDHLVALAGPAVLLGGAGNDDISGSNEADQIDAGVGDDLVAGGLGNDTISGGDGNDILYGDLPSDATAGGDDVILGDAGADTIYGGLGDDYLHGGDDRDQVYGQLGDDVLVGGANSDTLSGGQGQDLLWGDSEAFTRATFFAAGFAADGITPLIVGGSIDGSPSDGSDTLAGGEQTDWLFGGGGNDYLAGETGDDYLDAGDGNDTLRNTQGADVMLAGLGNDRLYGGDDAERMFGGDGDDRIEAGEGNNWIDAGDHDDYVTTGAGDDTISGGAGADRIEAGDGANIVSGGDNDDFIHAGSGNDNLQGDDGDDVIYVDAGQNTLGGGVGNDRLFGGSGADTISGGLGNDQIDGSGGADFLFGDEGNDSLSGGDGDDQLSGGPHNDLLLGGAGADVLHGDANDDVLRGGAGIDLLYGGDGADRLYGDAGDGANQVGQELHGGAGNDILYAYAPSVGASFEASFVGDMLYGDDGDDLLLGNLRQERLEGGEGKDQLYGDALGGPNYDANAAAALVGANDALFGDGGDDELFGGGGDDQLWGGAGTDRLEGQNDNDTLYGGGGIDVMVLDASPDYNPLASPERIEGHFGNTAAGDAADDNATDILLIEGDRAASIDDTILIDQDPTGLLRVLYAGLTAPLLVDWRDGGGVPLIEQFRVTSLTGDDHVEFLRGPTQIDLSALNGRDDYVAVIEGGSGDDTLHGTPGRDRIDGGRGSDVAFGYEGDDRLWGDLGAGLGAATDHDRLFAGAGNDDLIGGQGTNQLYAWSVSPGEAGEADFGVYILDANSDGVSDNGEFYTNDGGGLYQRESTGLNRLLGGANADELYGGQGSVAQGDAVVRSVDFLYGNGGGDTLFNSQGTPFESVDSGLGGDDWKQYAQQSGSVWYVQLTEGDDRVEVDYASIEGGEFYHSIIHRTNNATIIRFAFDYAHWNPLDQILNLQTGEVEASQLLAAVLPPANDFSVILIDALDGHDDIAVLPAVQKSVWIDAGEGNDTVRIQTDPLGQPSTRRDVILGGAGDDRLRGGSGEDWVFGGPGNDVLSGGADRQASDLLFGEAGDDVFQIVTDELPLIEGTNQTFVPTLTDYFNGGDGYDEVLYYGKRIDPTAPETLYDDNDHLALRFNAQLQRYEVASLVYSAALASSESHFHFFRTVAVEGMTFDLQGGDDEFRADQGYTLPGDLSGETWGLATTDRQDGAEITRLQVLGGDGDDILVGGPEADTIYGGAGADLIVGGWGDDRLFGEAGADRVYGLDFEGLAAETPRLPAGDLRFALAPTRPLTAPTPVYDLGLDQPLSIDLGVSVQRTDGDSDLLVPQAIGDYSGDGLTDYLVSSATHSYVLFGPLSPHNSLALDKRAEVVVDHALFGTPAKRMGDVDGDGYTDLLFHTSSEVNALLSSQPQRRLPTEADWTVASSSPIVELAALNWDGTAEYDLAVKVDDLTTEVWLGDLLNDGLPPHESVASVIDGSPVGSNLRTSQTTLHIIGDLNGDGREDLLIAANVIDPANGGSVVWPQWFVVLGGRLEVIELLGSGQVDLTTAAPAVTSGSYLPDSVFPLGDINQDGYDDVALVQDSDVIQVILGRANLPISPSPLATIADFHLDRSTTAAGNLLSITSGDFNA